MKKISLIIALCVAVPLASTACSKDKDSGGGDGDGDGDGDSSTGGTVGDGDGDGDGDTGGTVGDGDGDTGGMPGDGDGDTGGMGGFGGDGMGGMGGTGDGDFASLCATVCAVKVAESCPLHLSQSTCESACTDPMVTCQAEWIARITCEATLDETGWECDPNAGFLFPGYTQIGDDACGAALEAYETCVEN